LLGKFVLYDLPLNIASFDLSNILSLGSAVGSLGSLLANVQGQLSEYGHDIYSRVLSLKAVWHNPNVLPPTDGTLEYSLAVWDTKDRTIAILMGYLLVSLAGLGYLRVARFISGTDRGQRVEGMVAEGLHQAGGVMKVILIIGIEMIVFPLYCGSLLDIALMPLFENATLSSRIAFTSAYPLTSLFVHWFIGTCYMFHFALFVSMCRKIMRTGVLCKFCQLGVWSITDWSRLYP
jgi:E3 ubiquitin-protein ligase MARCH6